MKFYKAICEKHDYFTDYTTCIGELVTERERNSKFRYLNDDVFETVEVSKKKTYWIFGCRFECGSAREREDKRILDSIKEGEKMQAKLPFYND